MGFVFNGENAEDYGIKVVDVEMNALPESGDEFISIPFRHGQLVKNGGFKDKKLVLSCFISNESGSDVWEEVEQYFYREMRKISGWLYTRDYEELRLDNDDVDYRAKLVSVIETKQKHKQRRFSLEFTLYPFGFGTNTVINTLDVTSTEQDVVVSDGNFDCLPTYIVKAGHGGDFELIVNGERLVYEFGEDDDVYVDVSDLKVYVLDTNGKKVRQEHLVKGVMPVLEQGTNTIRSDKNLTVDVLYRPTYI